MFLSLLEFLRFWSGLTSKPRHWRHHRFRAPRRSVALLSLQRQSRASRLACWLPTNIPTLLWSWRRQNYAGFAPGVEHFANLPLIRHFVAFGAVGAHFINRPFASRQRSAAKEGVLSNANMAAPKKKLRITTSFP